MSARRLAFALAVVVSAAVLVGACSRNIQSDPEDEGTASARTALASTPSARIEPESYRTHLYSERDADVHAHLLGDSFENGATVAAIQVEVGDRVGAGQVLAILEDEEARLDLALARPEAEEAAATFARIEELFRNEVVSRADYEAALYAKERADAALERARLAVDRTRIRAPFAGVVSRRYVRVGQRVEAESPLFRITALAPLRARLLVPEERITAFRPGTAVRLTGANGHEGTARVLLVGPTVDPGSGTVEVVLELRRPGEFRSGAAVAVEIPADSVREAGAREATEGDSGREPGTAP